MEARWSARRVARQFGCSDCVVRSQSASSAAIQTQVAPSLGAPVSSRTIRTTRLKDIWDRGPITFNYRSDDNRVRLWRSRGERLNSALATHHSHNWWDGMGCHCLQYTVTPGIDPWHHDNPSLNIAYRKPILPQLKRFRRKRRESPEGPSK
ncbi:hypothetical protein TNCV_764631 [Trichonephila clavipes]|nr:hypothetical protein TNCV_764631 [Trichonephila clavipes]